MKMGKWGDLCQDDLGKSKKYWGENVLKKKERLFLHKYLKQSKYLKSTFICAYKN